MALNSVPIHRSANRVNLFLGGDRELVMFSGLLAATLVFAALDWRAAIVGVIFWFLAIKALRRMAKADPLMRPVYMRHRKYGAYLPARSMPSRTDNSWKKGKPY